MTLILDNQNLAVAGLDEQFAILVLYMQHTAYLLSYQVVNYSLVCKLIISRCQHDVGLKNTEPCAKNYDKCPLKQSLHTNI